MHALVIGMIAAVAMVLPSTTTLAEHGGDHHDPEPVDIDINAGGGQVDHQIVPPRTRTEVEKSAGEPAFVIHTVGSGTATE